MQIYTESWGHSSEIRGLETHKNAVAKANCNDKHGNDGIHVKAYSSEQNKGALYRKADVDTHENMSLQISTNMPLNYAVLPSRALHIKVIVLQIIEKKRE